MPRLIGAVLIFAASSAAGLSAAAMYRLRVEQLEAFARLIVHIGAQINSFLAPLDRIFAAYDNRMLAKCGFLEALRRDGGEAALTACRRRLYITETELDELKKFFMGLGRRGADEEARHCEYYEKRMSAMASKARSELAGKIRLCRSFGMLIGIMLAVILL